MKTLKLLIPLLSLLLTTQAAFGYYCPETQRWLNRDPLGEPGFEKLRHTRANTMGSEPNLYVFVANDPLDQRDSLGLRTEDQCQNDCLAFCRYSNNPGDCAVNCFNGCAKDPNYVPGLITPPKLPPRPPSGGFCNAIWNILKNGWHIFH